MCLNSYETNGDCLLQRQEQLHKLKEKLIGKVDFHEESIKHHEEAIARHKKAIEELNRSQQ